MSTSRALAVIPARRPDNRSRVENGALFITADGRSAWARRFRGLIETYTTHIGGKPTPPQVALIRRIATMDIEAEAMEGRLAEGQEIDRDLYNRQAGTQRRLLEQLGFEGSRREAVPTVEDLIAGRAR